MRRVFEPMEASETTCSGPIVPRAFTCVPPQSSTESCPASTTRTTSPYFSPKNAIAPAALGLLAGRLVGPHRFVAQDLGVDEILDPSDLLLGHRPEVAEVEPQAVGRDERTLLAHVVAEHLSQRPVEQVGAGVVAPDRLAALDGRWPPRLPGRPRSMPSRR